MVVHNVVVEGRHTATMTLGVGRKRSEKSDDDSRTTEEKD